MEGALTETLAGVAPDLESLGGAYLLFLASLVLSAAAFAASRLWLVLTPNRPAKDYGLYIVVVLVSLGIAATLENELVPAQATTLQYAMFPQLIILVVVHLWIYYDRQPWLIALGASTILSSMLVFTGAAAIAAGLHLAHWLTLTLLTALLGYLTYFSISTKRGFLKARSIYVDSKETLAHRVMQQKPWLGLPQWVALISASILLAMVNAALQGRGITEIPAVPVFTESVLLLVITCLVCAIPAATYWLAHKHWMPELTRFVWLVWIVVGFAFTYGNFLASLDRS